METNKSRKKGGQPGNDNASLANRAWRGAINRAVARRDKKIDGDSLAKIADKLIDMAESGDLLAIKELGDRVDGKATQQLDIDANLKVSHEDWLDSLK